MEQHLCLLRCPKDTLLIEQEVKRFGFNVSDILSINSSGREGAFAEVWVRFTPAECAPKCGVTKTHTHNK